ncbi:MAG: carboxypeptidase regulatory-like domain-containing protein [Pirellulaceae bacterium]|nr:carboxypeptidase regulatory-like domain-containing protein [Planctomycetales bacterium]MCC7338634.1 carboxypeptidase regulatory-like domain-containing protein [Pirellulaceae bacterium]
MVDGKPAEGASVVFFPAPPGEPSNIAAGVVDGTGQYTLITNMEPGVKPGKYKVTMTWPDNSANDSKAFSLSQKDPPDLFKSKYADPTKTKLSAEILASTTEIPPFELSIK